MSKKGKISYLTLINLNFLKLIHLLTKKGNQIWWRTHRNHILKNITYDRKNYK